MPYSLVANHPDCPTGKTWAVINSETGKRHGCHTDKESAREQQKALYAATGEKAKSPVATLLKVISDLFPDESADLDFYGRETYTLTAHELPTYNVGDLLDISDVPADDIDPSAPPPVGATTVTKEQHKRIANVDYPASNFAIVRDAQRPDTWGILLVAGAPNAYTPQSLKRAAALLTPGTNAFKALGLDASEITNAQRRIVAELRKLGVPPEQFPANLQTKELTEEPVSPEPVAPPTVGATNAGFSLKSQTDGRLRWFAVYSNNAIDDDNPPNILSKRSHQAFAMLVKTGAVPLPELWFWHIPGTRLGAADLVDVDANGIAYASGLIDVGQEVRAKQLSTLGALGVSHGMPLRTVLFDVADPRVIDFYTSVEISVLPLQRAANPLTMFSVQGESTMALNKEQRAALAALEYKDEQIEQIDAALGALDSQAASRQRKEANEVEAQTDETPVVYATVEQVTELTTILTARFNAIDAVLGEVGNAIKALKTDDATKIAKAASMTPAASLSDLISSLAISQPAAQIDGRSTLAKDGPKETKPPIATVTGSTFLDALLASN